MSCFRVTLAHGLDERERILKRIDMAGVAYELGLLLHECIVRRLVGRIQQGTHGSSQTVSSLLGMQNHTTAR